MTKKLFKDEKAMRALNRALKLTEYCHDNYGCKECVFAVPRGCGAVRVREAVERVLKGEHLYDEHGNCVV
jgi:hypothetical protein